MFIREAQWIGSTLRAIPDESLFPLLDVGSSTLEFRTQAQPHIEEEVFRSLRRRSGAIIHMDIKEAPGVDLVGDLTHPETLHRLRTIGVRTVLLSNVLQHLRATEPLCEALENVLPAGGHLVLSGPASYPVHRDPIDTGLRLNVDEVRRMFPGLEVLDSSVLDIGNWRTWKASERGRRSLGRTIARLLVPVYRPGKWLEVVRQSPYLIRHARAFVALLRKAGTNG